MNFGEALEEIKKGAKVSRDGWNGKGMFVFLVPAGRFSACTKAAIDIADEDGKVNYNPYFAIKNVNGTVSTWVPSVNDCLAEDWFVMN